jgi:hypothetical protein
MDRRDPLEAIQGRSFAPGATIVVEGLSRKTDAEWRVLDRSKNVARARDAPSRTTPETVETECYRTRR